MIDDSRLLDEKLVKIWTESEFIIIFPIPTEKKTNYLQCIQNRKLKRKEMKMNVC